MTDAEAPRSPREEGPEDVDPAGDAASRPVCASVPLDLKPGPALVLTLLGSAAFAILPLSPLIPDGPENAIRGLTALLFLSAAIGLRRAAGRARRYAPVADALLIAVVTQFLAWRFGAPLASLIGAEATGLPRMAAAKAAQSAIIVPAIVLLVLASGARLDSIYLAAGRLRYGATVGLFGFALFALILLGQTAGPPGSLRLLAAASPWLLVFVLANGFNEELLFRGLFLRRFEPLAGRFGANLAAAIVFTAAHVRPGRPLSVRMAGFLAAVFLLSLLLGYLMQRSRSLLAPWLLHAGADLLIFSGGFYT